MNDRKWTVAAAALVVLAATGLAIWAAIVPAEPTDEQLLKMVDPSKPTDYSQLRALLTPVRKVYFAGQPVEVDFQVLNTSEKPVLLKVPNQPAAPSEELSGRHLAAGLPLEHIFSRKPKFGETAGRRALVIHPYSDPIAELDDDVVYAAPGPIEPIVIRPGGAVGRRVDLARDYPSFRRAGRYIIQWRPYSDAMRSLTLELRVMTEEQATLETSMGEIRLGFFYEMAPNHVENFLDLARRGFYDNTLFHRVIEEFMVQGGDPLTADRGKMAQWGMGRGPRTLHQEINSTEFVPGVLGAARGPDLNSASCQFFIVTGNDARHLTQNYTAFGRVLDQASLQVAVRISRVARDPGTDRPAEDVMLKRIRVEPVAPTTQPDRPTTQPQG